MTALELVEGQWAKLGAGYAGVPPGPTPDIERLILDTARLGPASPRLVLVALTWLSRHSSLVAEHRLLRLVENGFEDEAKPSLGLLLDLALENSRRHDRRRNLYRPMKLCPKATQVRPYFEIECANEALRRRAERRASLTSKRWGLWLEPIALKYDALRPAGWMIRQNPSLAFRADFKGDLRATIILALQADPECGESVSELARQCGASRTAVLNALEDLELGRWIRRERHGRVCGAHLVAA
jgi:hypothetical protein